MYIYAQCSYIYEISVIVHVLTDFPAVSKKRKREKEVEEALANFILL